MLDIDDYELIKLAVTLGIQLSIFVASTLFYYFLERVLLIINYGEEFNPIFDDWILIIAVFMGLIRVLRTRITVN
jgi:hypothetical protein